MSGNFYVELSKKLKEAKDVMDKNKRVVSTQEMASKQEQLEERAREEEFIPTRMERPLIMPMQQQRMPYTQIIQQAPQQVQMMDQPRLIVQPQQVQGGPTIIAGAGGGQRTQLISERDIFGGEREFDEPDLAAASLKYKPISMEMPEEFELAGKGNTVAKEYIQKLKGVDEKFPLVNLTIKGQKVTVAWGRIRWNEKNNSLIYEVNEPDLNQKLKDILDEAKILLRQKLDIDFTKIRIEKAYEYLMQRFGAVVEEIARDINPRERVVLEYFVFRDFIGLNRLEPLLHDENIEDIHCDGFNIPMFVTHRKPLYGELQTNIVFQTKEELDSFVLRLAQKCGKALSVAEPLMDGSLPDGSRVQVTYGTDIAMRGSNFTIRKFTEKPITPIDEVGFGTGSPEIFATYGWQLKAE